MPAASSATPTRALNSAPERLGERETASTGSSSAINQSPRE